MICKKCGKEMNDEERYCLRCGYDQTISIEQTNSIFDGENNNQNSNNYFPKEDKNKTKIIIGIVVALVVAYIVLNVIITIFAGVMVGSAGRQVQGMHNTVMDALTPASFPE